MVGYLMDNKMNNLKKLKILKQDKKKKREGRKFTRKEALWARANENLPLIKLEWNEFNQPIGKGAKEFPHMVTTLIRTKHFPLNAEDWRDIDISHKENLIDSLACVYEMDERLEEHTYSAAAKKWKDYKADLKKARFKEDLSMEENLQRCDPRVHPEQWKWLVEHWSTEEAKERSERNKRNRSNVLTPHTTGSKSIARASHDWSIELGRKLSRHELFIRAHTPKTGVPNDAAQDKIDELKKAAALHPELVDAPIQKGDVFSHVFGRDPRGYVRGLGLGPTPASLGMNGWRKHTSTKAQRAQLSRDKAQEEVSALKGVVEQLVDEMLELREAIKGTREETPQSAAARNSATTEQGSHHAGSNPTPPATITGVGIEYSDADQYYDAYPINPDVDVMLPSRRRIPPQPTRNEGGGHEVILLSTERPRDVPVAKATIQSRDPETRVGGSLLGDDCYEVVVSTVMRSDHLLPRQYGKMKTLGDSIGQCIAWPHLQIMDGGRTPGQS